VPPENRRQAPSKNRQEVPPSAASSLGGTMATPTSDYSYLMAAMSGDKELSKRILEARREERKKGLDENERKELADFKQWLFAIQLSPNATLRLAKHIREIPHLRDEINKLLEVQKELDEIKPEHYALVSAAEACRRDIKERKKEGTVPKKTAEMVAKKINHPTTRVTVIKRAKELGLFKNHKAGSHYDFNKLSGEQYELLIKDLNLNPPKK
jgi:hypothetical protein